VRTGGGSFAAPTSSVLALVGAMVALAALAPAAAPASQRQISGLHDARYCELIELKGSPPTAIASVWNTLGLNMCPPAQWEAFDAGALAKELGDAAVVLNGPRHFLMDSASAEAGGVRAFHGLRMRRLAAIPIRSTADLAQTAYTDRTIQRTNSFRWKPARTVFELVAPGGDTYVMQSYAQIKDPALTLAKLGSLGHRLKPPAGWRYRARKLTRELVLTASGTATIVQDELQDTYQLATTTRHGKRTTHPVGVTGRMRQVTPAMPGTIEDHGTVMGTPFGNGSVLLVSTIANGRFISTFRLTFPHGSVSGTASLPFTITGNEIDLQGASRFTGGTGAYRGISGGALQAHVHDTLDGQSGRLSLKGSATY